MERTKPVERWLANVAYQHSGSLQTERHYKHQLEAFCNFIGKVPEKLIKEYEQTTDFFTERKFRRKYSQYIQDWIAQLSKQCYTKGSIRVMVASVKSFFKYSNLPLDFVPIGQNCIVYHNRDITRQETSEILRISNPRDRAFFAVLAQSGLRPYTICKLKIKHLEPDLSNDTVPLKIEVPKEIAKGKYRGHITFIAEESAQYLKDYLKTRSNLTSESWVFTKYGTEEQSSPKAFSHKFRKAARKLREKGLFKFEVRENGKPSELRLYSLRKFFRKHAGQAGFENVQFWMGHVVQAGQEEHYRPRDVEFHRKLYTEKAMAFLRLEQPTPTETDKVIQKQAVKIEMLEHKLEEYDQRWERMDKILADVQEDTQKKRAILEDYIAKHRIVLPKKLDKIIKDTDSNLEKIAHNRKKTNE